MKPGNLCIPVRKVPIPAVKYRKIGNSSFHVPPAERDFCLLFPEAVLRNLEIPI